MRTTMPNPDPTSVLFLTNPEHGQSNVVIAVMYELILLQKVDQIHVASFELLRSRVSAVQKLAEDTITRTRPETSRRTMVTFHALPGMSMHEQMHFAQNPPLHSPGFWGAIAQYNRLASGLGSWDAARYLDIYQACKDMLQDINACIVVIGNFFNPGIDACNVLGIRYFYLSSEMQREHRPSTDSLWHTLCKTPASAFFRRITTARQAAGIPGPFPLFNPCAEKTMYLLPTAPEIDFPQPGGPPKNVTCCGPILLPTPSDRSDDELDLIKWVSSAPTIVVCFGSALSPGEEYNRNVASAVLQIVRELPQVRILWKLDVSLLTAQSTTEILQPLLEAGRVRLENWIPLVAALETGKVACLVHHGGTNMFLEAISHGVPQTILPCYFLTYERANLAEHLGVGIYASKTSRTAPGCSSNELATSIMRVIFDKSFEAAARRLANIAHSYGGRSKAGKHILQAIHAGKECKDTDSIKNQDEMIQKFDA